MAGLQAYVAFAESARHGNFAAAARELGLSASAVAKSVARLPGCPRRAGIPGRTYRTIDVSHTGYPPRDVRVHGSFA